MDRSPLSETKPESVCAFEYRNQLIVASRIVLSRLGTAPIAIVLGSGLGGFSAMLDDIEELPYSEIPYLPCPTVKGHSGKIIMGYVTSKDGKTRKRIMCFSGRLHTYEGLPMYQVTFCARLAYLCGVHSLILTNAAGGCIPHQQAGSVVITTDFIRDLNYTVLAHSADDCMYGPRHMKADNLLDPKLTKLLIETAKETKFPNYSGVYWMCLGPCYETGEMVQFCIRSGAHSVGMSTVPSVLAAKNMGLRVAAMSLCTNVAAGLEDEELSHAVVVQNAKNAEQGFGTFVKEALLKMDDPEDYNPNITTTSSLKELKLNLSKLAMNVDCASVDELIFPRKMLFTYDQLYGDIISLRRLLSKVIDLTVTTSHTPNVKSSGFGLGKGMDLGLGMGQSQGQKQENAVRNREGPIPIWVLHDPFYFDTTTLWCPMAIPLKTMKGFESISTTTSARNAILNFGFDGSRNLIVVITGLTLSGLSFDEMNFVINLMYGVLGHKNLYFTNMFYAFPTATMYADDEKEADNSVSRGQYAMIADSVDFKGGFPRFPRPLFPPKETNTSDCFVRMKYGVFGNTKTTDSAVECLKGFKGFFNSLNDPHKTTGIYSYAFYPGPSFPTPAELNIGAVAGCPLSGITNPMMTPMARQLGHDGYSVAYIATKQEFDGITCSKGRCIDNSLRKDATDIIYTVSSSMMTFFQSSKLLFSPAAMNRSKASIFAASAITEKRLHRELSGLNVPHQIPQYQLIHSVDSEWKMITEAAEWLQNVWNFDDHPIRNALFSSFGHVMDGQGNGNNGRKSKKQSLVSVDLSKIPGWKEHFCGGWPYSHYHADDLNPFEWTLQIHRNGMNSYQVVVAPHFFTNTRIHPKRRAYLSSFYKYSPRFWNLGFLIRVLWKVGVQNVCFLSHLFGNDCSANGTVESLKANQVVVIKNYVECAKWSVLTGPNDSRLGPRFTPITDPIELDSHFIKVAKSEKFQTKMESVVTVHVPSTATSSLTTSTFYGGMGYQTRVLGLVPEIQIAQHLGLKKLCVGITDYSVDHKLENVKSFGDIVEMIDVVFQELDESGR